MKVPQELRFAGVDLIQVGKRLIKDVGGDDLSGAAAELAYRLFLAIFPFFIFLAAFGGFIADLVDVQNPTQEIMDSLGDSLPPEANTLLREQLDSVIESRNVGLISIGIAGAIFAASSGVSTITKALNRIYGVRETRATWKRYVMSISLTLLGGGVLIGGFIVLVVGQIYGLELAGELGMEGTAGKLFAYGRWPLVILLILTALAFIYWSAPNVDLPFRLISPGAVIATLGWLLMTYIFGIYVANFSSYNATYGTLGGVVIALVWFYLSGFVLFLGAEVNAVLAELTAPEKLPDRVGNGATIQVQYERSGGGLRQEQDVPALAKGPAPFALLAGAIVAALAVARLRRR